MNHFPQFAFIHWCDGFLRWVILWVVSSLSNWHMKSHWSQLNLGSLCSYIWRVKLEASLNSLPQTPHFWGLWHSSWWMFNSFMVFFTTLHSLHLNVRFLVSTFFFNAYVFVFSLPLVVALPSFPALFGLSSIVSSRSASAVGVLLLSACSVPVCLSFWSFCISSAIALSTLTWSNLIGSYVYHHRWLVVRKNLLWQIN